MRRIVWLLALLVCAAGAYFSFQLSQEHIRGGFGPDSLLGRMCEEGTASCDEVIKSEWGTVKGIPTAVWGLMYFTGVGLWYLLVGLPNRAGRWWQLLPIGGTLVGLTIAAALDYVMFATLPVWCPLCFITHVASLLLFAASVLMWPRRPRSAPQAGQERGPQAEADVPGASMSAEAPAAQAASVQAPASPRAGRVALSCVAIVIAAAALHQNFLHRHHQAEREKARQTLEQWAAAATRPATTQDSSPFVVQPEDAVWGDPNAPDTLVVFSDFECPMCGGFAAFWRKDIQPYAAGRARLVFRYFPMNKDCNAAVNSTLHERSCEAAEIAEAARRLGGNDAFWKMHDELFLNQLRGRKRLSPAELATKVGLEPSRLAEERKSPRVRERIQETIAQAREAGVKGTPVVFLNGRLVQTSGPDPVWQRFLASLKEPSSAPAAVASGGGADCAEVQRELDDCRRRLAPFVSDEKSLVTAVEKAPVQALAIRPDDPSKGNARPRWTVVVFSDFESPRCLDFASYWMNRIEPYVMRWTRIVFRYFPMNTACNPAVSRTTYAQSCESAAAAEAARMQGGNAAFWKMHDELFRNQLRRPRASYADMARNIGLDPARLERDVASAQVRARIQQDISFAQQAKVTGAPTVFLNGRLIPVWENDRLWEYFLNFTPTSGPVAAPPASRPAASR